MIENKNKGEAEIDILELGKKLWNNKKFVLKISIIGAIIGIIIAFSIPKKYTTTIVLTTESAKSMRGGMGVLASMTGINLGNNMTNDVLPPELYPDVLISTPFVQGLLSVSVVDTKQEINMTLYDYLNEGQKRPWWSYVFGIPGQLIKLLQSDKKEEALDANKYFIPKEEMKIIGSLRNSYVISIDKKTGVMTLEVTTQSPEISAFLGDTLTNYLQSYIIDQRTKKAKTDLINSEKLYDQSKDEYYKAQEKLARFVDRNQNISRETHLLNRKRLENESDVAYSVYSQMAQQVQMNRIKVQDDTPVFTIIQPPIEPLYPAKPNKKVILLAFVFLFGIGASGWVLKKDLFDLLKG